MRRRAPEFRRPPRRRFPYWICPLLLGVFVAVAFVLFFFQHQQQQDRLETSVRGKGLASKEVPHEGFDLTHELLSSLSFARQLADQMTLAKAYLVLAKEHSNLRLAQELSSHIRICQRIFSQAAVRGKPITIEEADPIISQLAQLIYQAQDSHYDISTTITALKSHALALEERANAAILQGAEFGQLTADSLPKSLHCLSIKLIEDWFRDPALRKLSDDYRNSPQLVDNNLYHFCIFSDNVLATSVVINSTVSNVDHPQQLVFHVVTDEVNYWAMITWFLRSNFKECTIEVRSVKEFSWLNASYSPLVKQKTGSNGQNEEINTNNFGHMALLNHLRFYIAQIYPSLEKVIFLDDDVVVQKDLTPLFSVDLHENVIGAVETCLEAFHRFYKYLNFSNPVISSKFDPQACGWAFGMNIIDLIAWRKADVTAKYHYWQNQNADRMLWRSGTLPPSLLAFYGLVEPLDRRWHVLGLGYDSDIDDRLIESAAVVHYNGNMKPWSRLAIARYKNLWDRFVDPAHPFIRDCSMY